MISNEYKETLNQLYQIALHKAVKLGLEPMEKAHRKIKEPAFSFKTIHVAGTNGKGSVCAKIAKALELEGFVVGLYTSPHIASFRERIQVNGEYISKEDVSRILADLFSLQLTFFEMTTLLAFLYFQEKKVDFAIIETGLGGRLDATNIIQPKLCVITTIGLDHTKFLGSTLDEIAAEKAGIIKEGVPVIIGPHAVHLPIIKKAAETNSPSVFVPCKKASFEIENQEIARQALLEISRIYPLSHESIEKGIAHQLPCRFEILTKDKIPIILDVAHNPQALERLIRELRQHFYDRSIHFIFGMSEDKEIEQCLEKLKEVASHIYFVQADNSRAASAKELLTKLAEKSSHHGSIEKTIEKALSQCEENDIIVITGSFYIMEAARKYLGASMPSDELMVSEILTPP